VWGEIELFAQALESRSHVRLRAEGLAITGTNGKTTTTLTGQLCERAGKTVRVAGQHQPAGAGQAARHALPAPRCRKSGCWNCRASS
jgi:UDP-N-acetylmuramoylalanine-D-glutamate ligase